ncbi:UNVERIFIED_CONTAM: Ethylene-responsive transcription factor RAP2-10 [Sesamum latifolium]|uniref:Ethylene-responsive transcription factor RAP2-10 n=1 Tax=Sesamum latifolium TaxID=2727402 RepID=A0AAW2WAX0_9LAMI
MEGSCCTSSSSSTDQNLKRKPRQHTQDKPYRGIRMRKWGKWVAEIREPNKRSRIWLGSYSSPVAAARAYDTAVFYLRGPSARLNFPECIVHDPSSTTCPPPPYGRRPPRSVLWSTPCRPPPHPEATRVGSPMKNPI